MTKTKQENIAAEMDAVDLGDYSNLNEKDRLDLVSLTDEVALAALSGVLAGAPSLEAVSAAVQTVWFKLVPEYFGARDAYYSAVFTPGEEDAPE